MLKQSLVGLFILLAISACGGSGGGGGNDPVAPIDPPVTDDGTISADNLLATGDDAVETGDDLTLQESTLTIGAQDKLTLNGKLTIPN